MCSCVPSTAIIRSAIIGADLGGLKLAASCHCGLVVAVCHSFFSSCFLFLPLSCSLMYPLNPIVVGLGHTLVGLTHEKKFFFSKTFCGTFCDSALIQLYVASLQINPLVHFQTQICFFCGVYVHNIILFWSSWYCVKQFVSRCSCSSNFGEVYS